MAEDTNELNVAIGADPSGLRDGMNEAANIVQRGAQRITSSLESIGNIGEKLAKFGTVLSTSVTLPIVALGTASIKAYGEIQSLQLGLEAVSGSTSKANAEFVKLNSVAKLPGLGMQEAVKGSINLQSIGISADKSRNTLEQFGNAVATVGKGRVEFERAVYGVQQLANTDFPLGEDLNIIKDAVPQVSKLLKEAFGTSRSDELTKLGKSSKEVLNVILDGLGKLPRVTGGIKGAFENLGDAIQQNLARLGKRIDEAFDISGIIEKLTNAMEKVISYFESLSPSVQKTILVIVGLAAVVGPLVLALGGIMAALPIIISGFSALGTVIGAVLSPIGLVVAAIAGLSYVIYRYISDIDKLNAAKNVQIEIEQKYSQEFGKAASDTKASIQELIYVFKSQYSTLEQRKEAYQKLISIDKSFTGTLDNQYRATSKLSDSFTSLVKNMEAYALAQAQVAVRAEKFKQVAEAEFNFGITQVKVDDARKKIGELTALYNTGKINRDKYFDELLKVQDTKLFQSFKSQKENLKLITAEKNVISKLNEKELQQLQKSTQILEAQLKGGKIQGKSIGENLRKQMQSQLDNQKNILKLRFGIEPIKTEEVTEAVKGARKRSEAWYNEEIKRLQDLKKQSIVGSAEWVKYGAAIERYQKLLNPDKAKETGAPKTELFYESEISRLEQLKKRAVIGSEAWKQLNEQITKYNELLNPSDLEPIKLDSKGLLDQFGNEYKSFNDFMLAEVLRTAEIMNSAPNSIKTGVDKINLESLKLADLTKQLNVDLKNTITDSISGAISDTFTSIGKAVAEGGNVVGAIGNSLLKAFSGFLSQMGELLIKYGTLAVMKGTLDEIVKTGGYQAIVAGIAAIAVGAALSFAGGAMGSAASKGMNGNISSSAGVSSGNNYTSSYMNGGGGGNNEIRLRVDGRDLVTVLNRNVIEQDRLNAG